MINPLDLASIPCTIFVIMNKILPLLIDVSSPVKVSHLPLNSKPRICCKNKRDNSYMHAWKIAGMQGIMGTEEY